jgi:hypothetical protein
MELKHQDPGSGPFNLDDRTGITRRSREGGYVTHKKNILITCHSAAGQMYLGMLLGCFLVYTTAKRNFTEVRSVLRCSPVSREIVPYSIARSTGLLRTVQPFTSRVLFSTVFSVVQHCSAENWKRSPAWGSAF